MVVEGREEVGGGSVEVEGVSVGEQGMEQ